MTLLRLLPIVFLFLSTTVLAQHDPFSSSYGSKWYWGVGLGKATPRILLDQAVGDVELDIPDELGGGSISPPISVQSEFASYGQKLFVGYDVGKRDRWAFEGSLINFGNYVGRAKTSVNVSGTSPEGIPYTISGSGEEEITADIYGLAFSAVHQFRLGKRISFFPRIGVSYMDGRIDARENVSVSITVPEESITEAELEQKSSTLKGLLPVVGFGFDVQLSKRSFLRTEFERYGHPTKEPYIDMWFINWGYRFK